VLPQNRTQTHDNRGKSTFNMCVGVCNKLLHHRQDTVHNDVLSLEGVKALAEVFYFVSSCSSHFSFSVLQKGLERWYQIKLGNVSANCLL